MVAEPAQITSLRKPPEGWEWSPEARDRRVAAQFAPKREAYFPGPRDDAESTVTLPTFRADDPKRPRACIHCRNRLLNVEPPLGAHSRGTLSCSACGKQIAWLSAPVAVSRPMVPTPVRTSVPRPVSVMGSLRHPKGRPIRKILAPNTMPAAVPGDWRRPGCGDRCVRLAVPLMGSVEDEVIEAHDADAHEAYIRHLMTPTVVRTGCLVVDLDQFRVLVNGSEVKLYGRRWEQLALLTRHIGRVVSQSELMAVRGPFRLEDFHETYIRVTMAQIRARLGNAGSLIETRKDFGYLLRAEPPIGGEP